MTREEAEAQLRAWIGPRDRYQPRFWESCIEAILAAVAAERTARDAKWRAWVARIEIGFRGSTIDRATLLFLERYPPPDREPEATP